MPYQGKIYQLVQSENFEEFLEAIGVDEAIRNAIKSLKPTVELRQDGDTYVLLLSSCYNNKEFKFKLGQEVQDEHADGVKVKSVYNFEGNKLKQVQKYPNGLEVTYDREFEPDQMTAVLKCNNVTCTRVYKAQ